MPSFHGPRCRCQLPFSRASRPSVDLGRRAKRPRPHRARHPVGMGCRICERMEGPQRAAPLLGHPL
ncbi:DUF2083 domain-containing protein [Streptomyces sp. NBC_01231]|nr:DUF2083 domain-containing protein [Streptomyces sp. NBC_01231]